MRTGRLPKMGRRRSDLGLWRRGNAFTVGICLRLEEFDKWLSTLLSGLEPAISFFFSTATFIWPRSSFTALILLSRSVLPSLNAAEALPQQARGSSCLLGIITLNVTNDLLLDRRFPLSSFSGAFIPAWEHGVVRLAQLAFARTLYDSIVRSS